MFNCDFLFVIFQKYSGDMHFIFSSEDECNDYFNEYHNSDYFDWRGVNCKLLNISSIKELHSYIIKNCLSNKNRIDPHYCNLCECVCVLCAQLQSCDDCELLHPELLSEKENSFTEALLDELEKS